MFKKRGLRAKSILKRIAMLSVLGTIVFGSIPVSAASIPAAKAIPKSVQNMWPSGDKLVKIAASQVGYKAVWNSKKTGHDSVYSQFVAKKQGKPIENGWCSEFASWCLYQIAPGGSADTLSFGIKWKPASTTANFRSYYKNNTYTYVKNNKANGKKSQISYKGLEPGMILQINGHTAIIEKVTSSKVQVIEGNSALKENGKTYNGVRRHSYSKADIEAKTHNIISFNRHPVLN